MSFLFFEFTMDCCFFVNGLNEKIIKLVVQNCECFKNERQYKGQTLVLWPLRIAD